MWIAFKWCLHAAVAGYSLLLLAMLYSSWFGEWSHFSVFHRVMDSLWASTMLLVTIFMQGLLHSVWNFGNAPRE